MDSFSPEVRDFAWKMLRLIVVTPLAGYAILLCLEDLVKVWKSKNRVRKWFSFCILFFVVAVLLGWLV